MTKSIQFTDTELVDLQKFYLQELQKAEKRVQDLKNTLAKLGVDDNSLSSNFSETDETAPDLAVDTVPKAGKKRKTKKNRQKPQWSEFILAHLQSQNRLVRVGSIIGDAVEQFDIEAEEQKKAEQAIYNGLNRLQKVNQQVISYMIAGKKGRYYGLRDWFTEEGTPKEQYVQQAEMEAAG